MVAVMSTLAAATATVPAGVDAGGDGDRGAGGLLGFVKVADAAARRHGQDHSR